MTKELKKEPERTAISEVETVRCIILNEFGQVLMLEKVSDDGSPTTFELPGGKIDEQKGPFSTLDEQMSAVRREVLEETGLNIETAVLHRLQDYVYEFENRGRSFRRRVHMFQASVPHTDVFVLNQSVNQRGELEFEHLRAAWLSKEELNELRQQGRLVGNSTRFDSKQMPN